MMNEIIETYRILEPPYTVLYFLSIYSFIVMIPSGVPFIAPSGGFIDRIKIFNFGISVFFIIILYFNEFTLLESFLIGVFWPSIFLSLLFPNV